RTLSVTISPAALIITTSALPNGTAGTAYSGATLAATGGIAPYSWSGSAPAGLTLSSSGAISSTPNVAGTFSFSATVTDSAAPTPARASRMLSVTLHPPPLNTTTRSLPGVAVGTVYSATLAAAGGVPPYTWSGSTPAGLTLSSSGAISGTPNAVGTFSFSATVT